MTLVMSETCLREGAFLSLFYVILFLFILIFCFIIYFLNNIDRFIKIYFFYIYCVLFKKISQEDH